MIETMPIWFQKLNELLEILYATQQNVSELRGREVDDFCDECIILLHAAAADLYNRNVDAIQEKELSLWTS